MEIKTKDGICSKCRGTAAVIDLIQIERLLHFVYTIFRRPNHMHAHKHIESIRNLQADFIGDWKNRSYRYSSMHTMSTRGRGKRSGNLFAVNTHVRCMNPAKIVVNMLDVVGSTVTSRRCIGPF